MNSVNGPSPYTSRSHTSDETLAPGDCDSSGIPSSPPMKPRDINSFNKYALSEPSRPPKITEPPISFDQTLPPITPGLRLRSADRQLIDLLDDGRHPEIPNFAEIQPLAPIDHDDDCDNRRWFGHPRVTPDPDRRGGTDSSGTTLGRACLKGESLKDLAAGALQKAVLNSADSSKEDIERSPAIDISTSTGQLSIHDNRPWAADNSPDTRSERRNTGDTAARLPRTGLPPIVSTDSGASDRTLPSLRSIPGLRDVNHSPSEQNTGTRHGHGTGYPRSPPLGPPHLPPLSASHGSPPISPPDSYQKGLPSPQSLPGSSPYNHYISPRAHLFTPDYVCTSTGTDVKSNEQGAALTMGEQLYPNGGFGSSTQPALYHCDFQGCKAPPFQTQYLLNSHANVHSQARPHYCPVAGCSRSEGGKGFKRKNEMIRHGLVHESPGYVCPFCPEKDHRYPRPDNLQRHVRVHHTDKSKDDPQLREVLAQRPDGPNRGRRRRGGA